MSAEVPAFDWPRFEAWLAVERQRRAVVPGFEHAMFFEWLRQGQPAAAEAAPEAPAAPAPTTPAAPRPTRPYAPDLSMAPKPHRPAPVGQRSLF